jgi:hypothetical protein
MYRATLLSLLSLAAFFTAAGMAPSARAVPNAKCSSYNCTSNQQICMWINGRIRCCQIQRGPNNNKACTRWDSICYPLNTITT